MTRNPRFSLLKSIFAVLCAASSCVLGDARSGAAQTVDESGRPDSMLVYAADLEVHPERYARADQILVFGMDSDRNIGRFRLKQGTHRFCLEGGAGFFTEIVLETDRGAFWPTTPAGAKCVQAELAAGIISVLLRHGDGVRPDPQVSATVRVDVPLRAAASATPLVDAKNSPVGGYWLIQDTNVNARGTFGLAMNFSQYLEGDKVLTLRSDISDSSFIRFPSTDGIRTYAYLNSQEFWSYYYPQPGPGTATSVIYGMSDSNAPGIATAYGPPPAIQIQDLGTYAFLGRVVGPGFSQYFYDFNDLDTRDWLYTKNGEGDTFQVLLRYFPDGSGIGNLRAGEVAVYDQCNYQGRAAVFVPLLGPGQVSPPFDLRSLSSSWLSLNGTLRSVRLGKGGGVYWGADPQHLEGGAIKDNACLSKSPENNLYVEPESNVLAVAHSVLPKICTGCDFSDLPLQGSTGPINFASWDLTSASFAGATLNNIDFSGATLSNAKFTGATLNYVRFPDVQGATGSIDLSGTLLYKDTFTATGLNPFSFNNAHLCGTSLHGAGPYQILDLTTAPFTNALVQLGGDCATDLSGNPADLSYSKFNLDVPALAERGPNWSAVNLTGATVNSPAGTVLSSQQAPLELGNARLAGVSMNGTVLDYAQGLKGKDLTGIQLVGASLRYVDLSNARLYSANLQESNLEGANLKSAYLTHTPSLPMSLSARLDGAFLLNVNLQNAQLSGAEFTNASFYGVNDTEKNGCIPNQDGTLSCATAAGATMDNTTFNGAYLYGVDFSRSTAQNVNFTNAYLVGSNFKGAIFSNNDSGPGTSFAGAFLQGANFELSTLPAGISFLGAYFDFSPGNTLTFELPSSHVGFSGYWGPAKQPVCAAMSYEQGSMVPPPTVGNTTCPDGTSVAGGCGDPSDPHSHWDSNAPLSPIAYTYSNPATYSPATPTPVCALDPQWNYGPGPVQRPERSTTGEKR